MKELKDCDLTELQIWFICQSINDKNILVHAQQNNK